MVELVAEVFVDTGVDTTEDCIDGIGVAVVAVCLATIAVQMSLGVADIQRELDHRADLGCEVEGSSRRYAGLAADGTEFQRTDFADSHRQGSR